jgi:hypothetical protein
LEKLEEVQASRMVLGTLELSPSSLILHPQFHKETQMKTQTFFYTLKTLK